MEVWQRFTIRARRAVVLAHNEALGMGMPLITTEHLLMGVLQEGTGLEVLRRMKVPLDRLRKDLREHMTPAGVAPEPVRDLEFTPEAQRALRVAYTEAKRLRHDYVGTEHLLVGLLHEGRGAAQRLLRRYGVDLARVRRGIGDYPPGPAGGSPEA
jgi:ATP-dependent Clp protease ATP-binding subunit ClpC